MYKQIKSFGGLVLAAGISSMLPLAVGFSNQAFADGHDGGGVTRLNEPSACETSCTACEECSVKPKTVKF